MENNVKDEINYVHDKINIKQISHMILMLLCSSLLYAFAVTCFINQSNGNIIAAGVSGLAMLISRV